MKPREFGRQSSGQTESLDGCGPRRRTKNGGAVCKPVHKRTAGDNPFEGIWPARGCPRFRIVPNIPLRLDFPPAGDRSQWMRLWWLCAIGQRSRTPLGVGGKKTRGERSMDHRPPVALPLRQQFLGSVFRHVIMWLAAEIQHRFPLLAGMAAMAVMGCCCTEDNVACRSPRRPCRLLSGPFSPCCAAAGDCAAAPWIMLAGLENPLSHHADALPSPHRRWFHPVPTKPVFGPGELLLRLETIPDDAVLESPPLLESAPHAQLAPDQPPPLPDEVSDDGG